MNPLNNCQRRMHITVDVVLNLCHYETETAITESTQTESTHAEM